MKVELREFKNEDRSPKIMVVLACEDEAESKIVDRIGNIGQNVRGEIRLSDGYGEHYILLEKA